MSLVDACGRLATPATPATATAAAAAVKAATAATDLHVIASRGIGSSDFNQTSDLISLSCSFQYIGSGAWLMVLITRAAEHQLSKDHLIIVNAANVANQNP